MMRKFLDLNVNRHTTTTHNAPMWREDHKDMCHAISHPHSAMIKSFWHPEALLSCPTIWPIVLGQTMLCLFKVLVIWGPVSFSQQGKHTGEYHRMEWHFPGLSGSGEERAGSWSHARHAGGAWVPQNKSPKAGILRLFPIGSSNCQRIMKLN